MTKSNGAHAATGYARRATRVWPTLLSAAAQAAVRARSRTLARTAEVHTALIMARTALDAYLHELFALRGLPHMVKFAEGPSSRPRLSKQRWRLVAEARVSLTGFSKEEKKRYQDVREMSIGEKLQALLLIVCPERTHKLIIDFESEFSTVFVLNTLRNAIVHHDFDKPSEFLLGACDAVRTATGLSASSRRGPWEEILSQPPVAEWACKSAALAVLQIESIEKQRKIHPLATRDAVVSAISPLKLS
ncbi:hypothetical protein [Bradyrhizobium sp. USDA 4506]